MAPSILKEALRACTRSAVPLTSSLPVLSIAASTRGNHRGGRGGHSHNYRGGHNSQHYYQRGGRGGGNYQHNRNYNHGGYQQDRNQQQHQRGGGGQGGGAYKQYEQVWDPEALARWERKLNDAPIYQKHARFFIMKSKDLESVQLSHEHGVWSTTVGPTRKLLEAWTLAQKKHPPSERPNLYLIFSVTESGGYQGFARLVGRPDPKLKPHIFQRQDGGSLAYEDNFPVKWETKLMLYSFRNLNMFPPNPLNEYKTIMQSKNCQELPFPQGNYVVQQLVQMQSKYKLPSNS